MNLDDVTADLERRMAELRAWQEQALSRFRADLGRLVGDPPVAPDPAPRDPAPVDPAPVDPAVDSRNTALAARVLAATSAHERRVLEIVRDDPRSQLLDPGQAAGPAGAGRASATSGRRGPRR